MTFAAILALVSLVWVALAIGTFIVFAIAVRRAPIYRDDYSHLDYDDRND